jgi:hypothetical protein
VCSLRHVRLPPLCKSRTSGLIEDDQPLHESGGGSLPGPTFRRCHGACGGDEHPRDVYLLSRHGPNAASGLTCQSLRLEGGVEVGWEPGDGRAEGCDARGQQARFGYTFDAPHVHDTGVELDTCAQIGQQLAFRPLLRQRQLPALHGRPHYALGLEAAQTVLTLALRVILIEQLLVASGRETRTCGPGRGTALSPGRG